MARCFRLAPPLTLTLSLAACAGSPAALNIPAPCLAPVAASLALAGQEPAIAAALRSGEPLSEQARQDVAALLDSLEVARTKCKAK